MTTETFNITTVDVQKYDTILARGLSRGLGEQGKQVCIEAALCEVLGLEHNDDPGCVARTVRKFKIVLNDSAAWKNPQSRAEGLRDLGLAQLGSLGVVSDEEFTKRLAEKTIRVLIPALFREVFSGTNLTVVCLKAADRCEEEGTAAAAAAAAYAAYAADAAYAASTSAAAAAAARAAYAEKFLRLSATLALEVLIELGSPGIALLNN